MKKLLLFVTMAASLLFTQCKKEESVSSAGKTVSMTVTAGPGSKTDITDAGAITWSTGDKLYVGCDGKYVGYLTIASGVGTPTGTFTGNVTLGEDVTGEKSFGFFYLGSNPPEVASSATSVDVSFAEQTGLREDLGSCHVGYGSATGTVINDVVTDINVMLVSKVALAHFSFTKDAADYTDALTLSGDNICNKMTVNFNSEGFSCTGTVGDISLTNTTSSEKYVMLVPTDGTTGEQTLTFAGVDDNVSGMATLADGIMPNKFYGKDEAIPVTLEVAAPAGRFTVDANGTTVEFAPGNLYWDGTESKFKFEENQWSTTPASKGTWDANHVSHFFWSKSASVAYAASYSESGTTTSDVFFTNSSSFQVAGETAGTWRTLSKDEWDYLLNSRTNNASSLRAWKDFGNNVKGLVILPDGTENPSTVMSSISSTSDLASSGAVFLPAAGYRNGTDVYDAGSNGRYWSGTPTEGNEGYAYYMYFYSGSVRVINDRRSYGYSVRLVR